VFYVSIWGVGALFKGGKPTVATGLSRGLDTGVVALLKQKVMH